MKEDLIKILKEIGIIEKKSDSYESSSNIKLPNYANVKKAYGYPAVMRKICDELWYLINAKTTCVAGIGAGGVPLATALSVEHNWNLTIVRDKEKDYGEGGRLAGYIPTRKDNVAVVDDAATTGRNLREATEAIKPTGAKIVGCYVIVKRPESTVNVDAPFYHLLELKDLL